MLRVIVKTDDANMVVNVGGSVITTFRTFHISDSALEEFMRLKLGLYEHRQIIGVEVLDEPKI